MLICILMPAVTLLLPDWCWYHSTSVLEKRSHVHEHYECCFTAGGPAQHKMTAHCAAVKALAWCPFQSNLLASGGGTADRCIKFWNTSTGALLNSIDTHSQVSLASCPS